MGLFSFNYNKPGKGVDPDAPEKKGFFLYWELIFDRISKHLTLNLFWAILSILWAALLFMFAPINMEWLSTVIASMAEQIGVDAQTLESSVSLTLRFIFVTEVMLLWGSGVASAMYAYVTRCFSRRDPVWIMSDGWDKIKENFKQGILLSVIDLVVLVLALNAIMFYHSYYTQTQSMIWLLLCSVTAMVFVIYTWAHFYIYQMMVTFEGSLIRHIKNSIIFAVANLPMNLFCTVIVVGVSVAFYMFLNPLFAFLLNVILMPMFLRFLIEFTVARKIKRTVLQDAEQKSVKVTYVEGEQE